MVNRREGYHNLTIQIPVLLWQKLSQEADDTGKSAGVVLTEILRRRYKVPEEELPKPKRAGRKPKSQ